MSDLIDACPSCQPGIPDAALPLAEPEDATGGRVADYQCASCGAAWSTFWDRDGWPAGRLLAPVSAEQADRHRAELGAAMSGSAA